MKREFSRYPNKYFVETGSYMGDGIHTALKCGCFDNIISIEISDYYYKSCYNKFKEYKNVDVVLGDSSIILWDIIKDIDTSITFWLDGHFSGGNTGKGKVHVPLLLELDIIEKHHIKNHTILIDDIRLCRNKDDVVDWTPISEDELIVKLKSINPEYNITYHDSKYSKDDILVAVV